MNRNIIFILINLMILNNLQAQDIELNSLILSSNMQLKNDLLDQVISAGDLNYLDCALDFISISILNKSDLRILRNAIFAKYGYIFKSKDLSDHFLRFSWYKPSYSYVYDKLNDYDKYNIEQIQFFEKNEITNSKLDIKQITGVWSSTPIMPDDWPERFMFYSDGNCIYGYSNMQPLLSVKYLYGKYKIVNGLLEIEWNKRTVYEHNDTVSNSGDFGYEWTEVQRKNEILKDPLTSIFNLNYLGNIEIYNELSREVLILSGSKFYKYYDDPNEGLR